MSIPTNLKRGLNLFDSTTIVIGSMIGSGIFIVSSEMARVLGSPKWLLFAWLLTGIVTIIAALSYGELASMFPQAGGQYVYLREAYGRPVGFLYGWTLFAVIQTGGIAAICVAFSKFTGVIFPFISHSNWIVKFFSSSHYTIGINTENLLAILTLVFLAWINTRGLEAGKLIQNVFTVTKVIAIIGLILLGLSVGRNIGAVTSNFQNLFSPVDIKHAIYFLPVLGAAMVGSLFSSESWNNITFTAGEVINPKKNIPLSLLIGVLSVTIIYLLVNISYLCVLPLSGIQHAPGDRVATAVMGTIFGKNSAQIMALLIMISAFGCANGMTLAGARVYYAMAKDNLFFKFAEKTNKNLVPANALIMQCAWACVLCLSGTYHNLLDYIIFSVLVFYVLTVSGIFILRIKKPNLERPYKAIGYPFFPLLYILFAALLAVDLLIFKPNYTWPGLFIVLLGIPIYLLWGKKSRGVAN